MQEAVQLVIFETKTLPRGYKALEELSQLGLEPLEFYPHAHGVRILLKAPAGFTRDLPSGAIKIETSITILKALLSQTGCKLKTYLVVVETKSFSELVLIASQLEKIEAEVVELRTLRSNPEKNYGIFTLEAQDKASKILSQVEHSFLSATSAVLKDFLGFS